MGNTFTNLILHVIFSTKHREPMVDADIQADLFSYMGGIVRELGGKPLLINGTADHVHILMVLTATVSVSDALRTLKANSSRWIHDRWPQRASFGWQSGYGAFTVSHSSVEAVKTYIQNQKEHHHTTSFQEEFLLFLQKHQIPYDPRYIWE